MDDDGTIGCIGCIGCLWFFGIITGNTAMILVLLAIILYMEKLIELLNKYEKKRIEKINSEGKLMVKLSFRPYTEESLTNKAYRSCWLEICSKYYGFIKWLVENDKINRDNVLRMGYEIEDGLFYHYDDYYCLLMLLSISDTPIEDLLLYLK